MIEGDMQIEQPDGWRDEQLQPSLALGALDRDIVERSDRELARKGWTVIDVADAADATSPGAGNRATALVSAFARPIDVFASRPIWRALLTDLSRDPASSGGVGEQAVHMDFVNAAQPPDLVCLYCFRADPNGGGASVIAPIDAIQSLVHADRVVLSQPTFRDGEVSGLNHVGEDINPFAVWAPHAPYPLRWTGKLLHSTKAAAARGALSRLAQALDERSTEIALHPGQLLIVNQRRAVHGRRALVAGQEDLTSDQRRLLMHAFGRLRA
jgi:hypothetical protein